MWSIIAVVMIGLLLTCLTLYNHNKKLQQKVNYLQPIVETVENVRDIIYYCETVPKLNYRYLSSTVNELIGPNTLEEHLLNPEKIFDIVHPDDREILMKKRKGTLNFSDPIKVRFRNHHGQYIWFEEYATPVFQEGHFVAVQGVFRNIDEKVALQQQLEYKSSHDALTNLYNREFFQTMMKDYDENEDAPIAVIVADLDELKFVNDRYGHQIGDALIQETAIRLKTHAQEDAIIARIGGDEFAILLPNVSILQTEEFIKDVRFEMGLIGEGPALSEIKISIGYAYGASSKGVMEQLLKEADAKMYREKNGKKECPSPEKSLLFVK